MFEKTTDVDNVKDFVTESTNLIKHYSKQQIKENNEKVIRLIKKNKLDEFVEIQRDIAYNIAASVVVQFVRVLMHVVVTMDIEGKREVNPFVRKEDSFCNEQRSRVDFIEDFFVGGATCIMVAADEDLVSTEFLGAF
jgi:hypothetical protein